MHLSFPGVPFIESRQGNVSNVLGLHEVQLVQQFEGKSWEFRENLPKKLRNAERYFRFKNVPP